MMARTTRWNDAGKWLYFEDDATSLAYADSIGYTRTAAPAPPAVVYTKLRRQAFIDRFPKNPDGVTNKYSSLELFLNSDSYAASLTVPVTGAALHQLRLLIITGTGAMNRSEYVDYLPLEAGKLTDAERFTGLLVQPSIPVEFRLSVPERTKMLSDPITEAEAFK